MAFFCDIDDVKDILSSYGVSVHTDDSRLGIGDPDQQQNAIERAHTKVQQYITRYYDVTPNLGNVWLKWCTAYFAVVQLFRRRGNQIPAGLEAELAEYKDFLEQVQDGQAQIPEGIVRESGYGMCMSNVYIDQRFRDTKVRTNPQINTGDQSSNLPRSIDYDSYQPQQP